MQKGDLITLALGLFVILIVSLIFQHPSLDIPGIGQIQEEEYTDNAQYHPLFLREFAEQEQGVRQPIFTIQLVENPFGYPRIYIPGSASFRDKTFILSEDEMAGAIPVFGRAPYTTAYYETIGTITWVPIGVLEQKRGGVSSIFTIPDTPFWRIQIDIQADIRPGQALFQYVLCDAETGTLYDGGEIMGPGTRRSVVVASGKDMYFIINARNIDNYRIEIQVPAEYL